LGAVAVAPEGVWVAWGRGAALVPGPTGPVVRVPLGPPAAVPSLARVAGRTWLGLGRRVVGLHPDGRAMPTVRVAAPATVSAAGTVLLVGTGEGEVALDPRLGVRTAAAPRVRGPAWVADPALGTVTPVDPATGAPTGAPLEFEDLTGVAEAPDGTGYAVQGRGHMGVARLEADGPSVVWRTAIPPA
jgi:hypothetical protein